MVEDYVPEHLDSLVTSCFLSLLGSEVCHQSKGLQAMLRSQASELAILVSFRVDMPGRFPYSAPKPLWPHTTCTDVKAFDALKVRSLGRPTCAV